MAPAKRTSRHPEYFPPFAFLKAPDLGSMVGHASLLLEAIRGRHKALLWANPDLSPELAPFVGACLYFSQLAQRELPPGAPGGA